jgi:hypothetical protein
MELIFIQSNIYVNHVWTSLCVVVNGTSDGKIAYASEKVSQKCLNLIIFGSSFTLTYPYTAVPN